MSGKSRGKPVPVWGNRQQAALFGVSQVWGNAGGGPGWGNRVVQRGKVLNNKGVQCLTCHWEITVHTHNGRIQRMEELGTRRHLPTYKGVQGIVQTQGIRSIQLGVAGHGVGAGSGGRRYVSQNWVGVGAAGSLGFNWGFQLGQWLGKTCSRTWLGTWGFSRHRQVVCLWSNGKGVLGQ